MRWSLVELDQGLIHIARVKGSNDSTHSLDYLALQPLGDTAQASSLRSDGYLPGMLEVQAEAIAIAA